MEKVNINHWLHLRLAQQEKEILLKSFQETTQQKLSDFAQATLLGKPVLQQ